MSSIIIFLRPSVPVSVELNPDSAELCELNRTDSMSTEPPAPGISSSDIVTINVSGLRFQTTLKTLQRYPSTLLGNKLKRAPFYNADANEYFFDRHRLSFEAILYYYQSPGRLRRPTSIPVDTFVRELKFFEMDDEAMQIFWEHEGYCKPPKEPLPKNPLLRKIWLFMEYPDSSFAARFLAFFSVFVIVVSTLSFCLETIPELRNTYVNVSSDPLEDPDEREDFKNPFFVVEMLCICWFTVELFLRFISSPSKLDFCKSFMNIIDMVAILPFFINIAMTKNAGSSMSFAVLRVLRLVRVFRIFKLSRHSRGLQILGKTVKASVQELTLLIFFLGIGIVLFSSAVYFVESGIPGTKFESIPAAFWYSIVTMTTVGYGDLVPIGPLGKLVGSLCTIVGVLVLALPVPVIVANFKHFYRQETRLSYMNTLGGEPLEETFLIDDKSQSTDS
ncbi:unnamed protein product [Soboliphyme baturini]|uniref:BTB domain-containing protein n=1 Tax=Soboliphyme baturini TaxID=241478 RepID=A0A183J7S1_9BILA|nr:unnamed protein product [Soboliphyme baturini]